MLATSGSSKPSPLPLHLGAAVSPTGKVDRAAEFPASRQSFGPFEGAGAVNVTYDRNETIFYDGDDAEYCFRVLSGMVRLCKITEDGRRQISAFLAPGDVFGWTLYPCHSFSAEAVTDVVVQKCRRARVEETIRANPAAGRALLAQVSSQLAAAHDHMMLLGRMTAPERVAWFLLDLAKRLPETGRLILAMNRKDMADFLGLTVETVSRVMTQLKRKGFIAFTQPERIELKQRAALERLAMAE